jgi:hypothetical protein
MCRGHGRSCPLSLGGRKELVGRDRPGGRRGADACGYSAIAAGPPGRAGPAGLRARPPRRHRGPRGRGRVRPAPRASGGAPGGGPDTRRRGQGFPGRAVCGRPPPGPLRLRAGSVARSVVRVGRPWSPRGRAARTPLVRGPGRGRVRVPGPGSVQGSRTAAPGRARSPPAPMGSSRPRREVFGRPGIRVPLCHCWSAYVHRCAYRRYLPRLRWGQPAGPSRPVVQGARPGSCAGWCAAVRTRPAWGRAAGADRPGAGKSPADQGCWRVPAEGRAAPVPVGRMRGAAARRLGAARRRVSAQGAAHRSTRSACTSNRSNRSNRSDCPGARRRSHPRQPPAATRLLARQRPAHPRPPGPPGSGSGIATSSGPPAGPRSGPEHEPPTAARPPAPLTCPGRAVSGTSPARAPPGPPYAYRLTAVRAVGRSGKDSATPGSSGEPARGVSGASRPGGGALHARRALTTVFSRRTVPATPTGPGTHAPNGPSPRVVRPPHTAHAGARPRTAAGGRSAPVPAPAPRGGVPARLDRAGVRDRAPPVRQGHASTPAHIRHGCRATHSATGAGFTDSAAAETPASPASSSGSAPPAM